MISHIRGGKRTPKKKKYYPVCNLILCSCLLKRDFFLIHSPLHLFFTHLFIFIWTSTWKILSGWTEIFRNKGFEFHVLSKDFHFFFLSPWFVDFPLSFSLGNVFKTLEYIMLMIQCNFLYISCSKRDSFFILVL